METYKILIQIYDILYESIHVKGVDNEFGDLELLLGIVAQMMEE